MSLRDLDRASIEQALAEHDEIGRSAFLDKYGFDQSRSYYLLHAGLAYDSKAICGAAHGYLGPSSAPLLASKFSGGKDAAAKTLENLGFEICSAAKDEILHNDETPVGASCQLGRAGERWTITLHSRGGPIGASSARNPGYLDGLRVILQRLGQHSTQLVDAVLDTAQTRNDVAKGARDPRDLHLLAGRTIALEDLEDVGELVNEMTGNAAAVRSAGAKGGGNRTKEIRLEFVAPEEFDAQRLREVVIQGRTATKGFLLTWNPDQWQMTPKDLDDAAAATAAGETLGESWSVGNRTGGVSVGDTLFLFRQGVNERGLLARGRAVSSVYQGPHWDGSSREANYVDLDWLVWLPQEEILPVEELKLCTTSTHWDHIYASGQQLKSEALGSVESAWRNHLLQVQCDPIPSSYTDPVVIDEQPEGGRRERTVKVRVGQRKFRQLLLSRFGEVCAISGPQPQQVLEAAHLYSYADEEFHDPFGGLLLRRDIHRLFDAGLICIDPEHLTIHVDEQVRANPTYGALHEAGVQVNNLSERSVTWLRLHWTQHRSTTER
jgi:hypothetical protein